MVKLEYGVVAWNTANGQQLEAIAVKKLDMDGDGVRMKYNGQIWTGQIISLHENMKSAKSSLDKELQDNAVGIESDKTDRENNKRKRTKNKRFEEYDVSSGQVQDDETTAKKKKTALGKENNQQKSKMQDGKTLNKKEKTTSGKKQNKQQNKTASEEDAAEKERKRLERERAREEKQKERRALAERNNNFLNQLAATVGRDPFTTDVVDDCVEIMNVGSPIMAVQQQVRQTTPKSFFPQSSTITTPENTTVQLERTITELQRVVPRPDITITQLQETLRSLQHDSMTPPNSTENWLQQRNSAAIHRPQPHVTQSTPKSSFPQSSTITTPENNTVQLERTLCELQSVTPQPDATTQLQETLRSLQHDSITPTNSTENQPQKKKQQQVATRRPTVGGKCPRKTLIAPTLSETDLSDEEESCASCKRLRQKVKELQKKLAVFEEQVSSPPRPGKVHSIVADKYQMVELAPGSGVYIYQHLLTQAVTKPTFKSASSFLLNCFYTNEELVGMNLTGANGKAHPDKDILDSIIGFVMREMAKTSPSPSAIKFSLRNKLSALESRRSKKESL